MSQKTIDTDERPEVDPALLAQKAIKTISFSIVSDRKVNFTKAMAEKHLVMPAFPGERELRDKHVDDLLAAAKAGSFLFNQTNIASCVCEWDGIERRLNGQHTAWMRSYMPDEWECPINYVRYSAPTWDDFRRLYSSIDRGAPRTRGHVVVARVYDSEEYTGITIPTIKQVQGGLSMWLETGKRKLTPDQIATHMTSDHLNICLKVAHMLQTIGSTSRTYAHLRRAAVVGAMLATSSKNHQESVAFWQTVADGINIETNADARYKLREFLIKKSIKADGAYQTRIDGEACNSEAMYRVAVNAWNKWRAREPVKTLVPTKTRMAAK